MEATDGSLVLLFLGAVFDAADVGMVLFQQYNIPLQVVGTLILVASIGVVILSKRELK